MPAFLQAYPPIPPQRSFEAMRLFAYIYITARGYTVSSAPPTLRLQTCEIHCAHPGCEHAWLIYPLHGGEWTMAKLPSAAEWHSHPRGRPAPKPPVNVPLTQTHMDYAFWLLSAGTDDRSTSENSRVVVDAFSKSYPDEAHMMTVDLVKKIRKSMTRVSRAAKKAKKSAGDTAIGGGLAVPPASSQESGVGGRMMEDEHASRAAGERAKMTPAKKQRARPGDKRLLADTDDKSDDEPIFILKMRSGGTRSRTVTATNPDKRNLEEVEGASVGGSDEMEV